MSLTYKVFVSFVLDMRLWLYLRTLVRGQKVYPLIYMTYLFEMRVFNWIELEQLQQLKYSLFARVLKLTLTIIIILSIYLYESHCMKTTKLKIFRLKNA